MFAPANSAFSTPLMSVRRPSCACVACHITCLPSAGVVPQSRPPLKVQLVAPALHRCAAQYPASCALAGQT